MRKLMKTLAVAAMSMAISAGFMAPAKAMTWNELNNNRAMHVSQPRGTRDCTSRAATMLIRRGLALQGRDWRALAGDYERQVKPVVRAGSAGLRFSFNYKGLYVEHEFLQSGRGCTMPAWQRKQYLQNALRRNPEGVVVWKDSDSSGGPHAVVALYYDQAKDDFIVWDSTRAAGPIPMKSCNKVRVHNLFKIWRIKSPSIPLANGTPSAAPVVQTAPAGGTRHKVVNTDGNPLRIRSGRGTGNRVVGSINAGQTCFVYDVKDGWGKVWYNGINGYASMKHLQNIEPKPAPLPAKGTPHKVVNTDGKPLRIRAGRGTGHRVIGSIDAGKVCEVFDVADGWARVRYGNINGYASMKHLQNIEAKPQPKPAPRKTFRIKYYAPGADANTIPAAQYFKENDTVYLTKQIPKKSTYIETDLNYEGRTKQRVKIDLQFYRWKIGSGNKGKYDQAPGMKYTGNRSVDMYGGFLQPKFPKMADPKRDGYTFAGWYTAKTGGRRVKEGTPVGAKSVIYARWTPKTYRIRYYCPGGEAESLPAVQYFKHGESIRLSKAEPVKYTALYFNDNYGDAKSREVKVKYRFYKWKCGNGGYVWTGDMIWSENRSVDFYAGVLAPLMPEFEAPKRDGWKFLGYSKEREGGKIIRVGEAVAGKTTLYAQWEKE